MKIAVFTDAYLEAVSGIASSIKAQKQGLEKLGHEVVLFCPGWDKSLVKLSKKEQKNVVVVPTCKHLHFGGVPIARNPKYIEDWVIQNFLNFASFDLVHVHYEAGCSLAGILLAKRFKKPLVQTMHGREDSAIAVNVPYGFKTLAGSLLNGVHASFLPHSTKVSRDDKWATSMARVNMWEMMVNHANYADRVIVPSHHFAQKLKYYGMTSKTEVLSNGVADDLLILNAKIRKLKAGEPLKMIWNSRISREKRFRGFLQTLHNLNIPYELHVYGGGNDLNKAKKIAKKWNLNAHFYGTMARDKIFDKMAECHLGVLTSFNFDNQPMTLLEAEMTGLPVFFCDPDMKEVVPDGSFVCSKNPTIEAMAEALRDLVKHPERVEKMSKVMLEHRGEILQSVQIEKLLKIYEDLIK